MKITNLKGYALEVPAKPFEWRKGIGRGNIQKLFLLRLITDVGLEGIVLIPYDGIILCQVLEKSFKYIIGEDPLNREYLWGKNWYLNRIIRIPIDARGIIDLALWDLGAKYANLPLYKFVGAAREKIKAYASTFTYFNMNDYRKVIEKSLEQGYKAIKLHVTGDVKKDIEICKFARDIVGDDIELMLDSSGAYNHREAFWAGKQLEKLDYHWFEEPIRDYDLYGLKELNNKLNIPLAVAETTIDSHFDAANHIINQTADIILTDWRIKSGLTSVLKTAHLCESFGITCQIHGFGLANLHSALSIINTEYYEALVPVEINHFLQINPPISVDKDGYVYPPDRPGIGEEIDWKQVKKYTLKEVII